MSWINISSFSSQKTSSNFTDGTNQQRAEFVYKLNSGSIPPIVQNNIVDYNNNSLIDYNNNIIVQYD